MDNNEMQYHRVASIGEISEGACRQVKIGEVEIALCNLNGEYYAIGDMCPHRGASLSDGFLSGEKVFCPWHCFDFNLKTGECEMVPSLRVPTYQVKIDGGEIYIVC